MVPRNNDVHYRRGVILLCGQVYGRSDLHGQVVVNTTRNVDEVTCRKCNDEINRLAFDIQQTGTGK